MYAGPGAGERGVADYFDSILELASAFTYGIPITPAIWNLLPLLHHAFFNGALDYFCGTIALASTWWR